jgi:hypothetical protein
LVSEAATVNFVCRWFFLPAKSHRAIPISSFIYLIFTPLFISIAVPVNG